MKSNKNIFTALLISLLAFTSFSCSDYLDYDEDKVWTDELVWTEYTNVEKYLAAIYDKTPSTFAYVGGAFLAASTDDAEHANLSSDVERYNTGALSEFSHPNSGWSKNYDGIRLASKFIENADTLTLYKNKWNDNYNTQLEYLYRWRGEARFLKAYFYFELIKRYGGVPIVEKWVNEYLPADATRKPFNEVVEYIALTCDSAMKYLPVKSEFKNSDMGHATKGAALALKTRAFLYAASELNNPTGAYHAYYDSCAVNAARLFNMGYSVSGVNYNDLFTPGSGVHFKNNDVIFDKRAAASNSLEKSNYPVGFNQGSGHTNPTQDLVDAFEMADGTPFDWDNSTHAAAPYENRDPRFYATILHNGAQMDVGNVEMARKVETFNGGLDGPVQEFTIGTRTGYYLKKYIHTNLDFVQGNMKQHYWFLFRYAEVLLNYAEAMNELHNDPDVDPSGYGMTAREAVNMVRSRVNMPAVVAANADEFRTKLRNERRVELAFEDHRHWDVRRWNVGVEFLNSPVHGVDIERQLIPRDEDNDGVQDVDEDGNLLWDEEFSYEVKKVEERVFEEHMNLYPIPRSEVYSGVELPQNPGW
ncbi:RagB/SusD family nutrient uptake outer membrane protein [Carboxylicivirga marina]|uniref:RagB/SusD family nutrient uptake outer membrane protein n=1 Tax=Carboxylicivirga marina TaxID=2800988 RepID=A0ABS1HKZ5_9BACT|nr:RagB/SusD family nutrient uptake outer membrane protein [Carboxylicivirga marina]MBK3518281.1 RagB/SusD family nutrient uptake outer membrane protein [Carboxylicivirga marina]